MKQVKVTWCHSRGTLRHATKEGQHMRERGMSGPPGMQSVPADCGSEAESRGEGEAKAEPGGDGRSYGEAD